jgi:hypothetical protein
LNRDLKSRLDDQYRAFDAADAVADPVNLVRRFTDPADVEIAAFCAAALAFGRVASVMQSIEAQVRAGAKAMFVAEPAANKVYFSPKQLAEGADTFERYAMAGNRQIKRLLDEHGVDLVFHCCGELTDEMVKDFGSLDPAILSLGSSRKLWEDARLISKRTVLFGNLPTKRFSTDELSKADIIERFGSRRIGACGARAEMLLPFSLCPGMPS